MKISRNRLKEIVREVMTEESEYQNFFKKALEKTGKSIPQMSDEEKKAFFNKIDKAWKGKGEKREQVEELTKAQEKLPPALKKAIEKKEKNESVNEAKTYTPKQVKQALEKMVKQLKVKWKQKGGYENFGQKELRKFKDTFNYNPYGSSDERKIADLIDSFEDWAMDYSG